MVRWKLILKEFGPSIQHIYGVDNIVADTLSIFPSTPIDKNKTCTRKAHFCGKKLFAIVKLENNEDCFPLNLLILQIEQQK